MNVELLQQLPALTPYSIYNLGCFDESRDSSVMNRVQLGHTRLTHSHLLSGEPPPICSVCQTPLTVQHFVLDCPQFTVKRAKYFTVSSLKDLFYHVNAPVP